MLLFRLFVAKCTTFCLAFLVPSKALPGHLVLIRTPQLLNFLLVDCSTGVPLATQLLRLEPFDPQLKDELLHEAGLLWIQSLQDLHFKFRGYESQTYPKDFPCLIEEGSVDGALIVAESVRVLSQAEASFYI